MSDAPIYDYNMIDDDFMLPAVAGAYLLDHEQGRGRAKAFLARRMPNGEAVGAALRCDDGRVFSGANIEVASFPEGWCAETTALGHYIMGGGGKITEIAVIAERMPKVTPCGGCRQRLAEFARPETKLHLCDANGVVRSNMTFREIIEMKTRKRRAAEW